MNLQRHALFLVLASLYLGSLACDLSEWTDDVEATEVWLAQTANAAVAEFDEGAAQAETAVRQTLTAEAQATEEARLALTPSATPTHTATPTDTALPTATPTASPTATPVFSALLTIADDGGDNVVCVGGAPAPNPSLVADIGMAILSSDATTVTFKLEFPGLTDLAGAATNGLHEFGVGLYDSARSLPPTDPAQLFSGLGNQFLSSARFGANSAFTVAAQQFRDGAWTGGSASDVVVVMAENRLEMAAPISYFPPAGTLFLYTGYAGECDMVGLAPDRQLVIQFARQEAGLVFRADP